MLAEGRTAEVFGYGKGRVLKLDRPDWNGLSAFGGAVLVDLADGGLSVARSRGTVTLDERCGVILTGSRPVPGRESGAGRGYV